MNKKSKIKLNKLFTLFNTEDIDINQEIVLSTFKYVNITYFTNYILKFDNIIKGLSSCQNIAPELSIIKQRYIIYLKGLVFLKNLDLSNEMNYLNFKNSVNVEFIIACKLLLEFFENEEKYEYCSIVNLFINEGKQILKTNLAL